MVNYYLKRRFENLLLRLSDCDGMCMQCNPALKSVCERQKGGNKRFKKERQEVI